MSNCNCENCGHTCHCRTECAECANDVCVKCQCEHCKDEIAEWAWQDSGIEQGI